MNFCLRLHGSDVLLCPGGLACCIGGIIAGPNSVFSANTYATLDGVDFADSANEQDPGGLYDNADLLRVETSSALDNNPDFSLIDGAPRLDPFNQAFFPPADSSSFITSSDNIFSAPLKTDYTAFLEQGDLSGFRLASAADQSDSIFSDVNSWNSGETQDLLLTD